VLEDPAKTNKLIYEAAYGNGYYPLNGVGVWKQVIENLTPLRGKCLDVGCGTGAGMEIAREAGINAFGVDIAEGQTKIWEERGIDKYCTIAPAHSLPHKDNEFDFVVCSEVMEHIPKELVEASLSEIYRVGSRLYLFTIALIDEKYPLLGYIKLHVTQKPAVEWADLFKKVGFCNLKTSFSRDENSDIRSIVILAEKEREQDGK